MIDAAKVLIVMAVAYGLSQLEDFPHNSAGFLFIGLWIAYEAGNFFKFMARKFKRN